MFVGSRARPVRRDVNLVAINQPTVYEGSGAKPIVTTCSRNRRDVDNPRMWEVP
jgi:hypothetical protein